MRVAVREANFLFLFVGLLTLLIGVPLAEQLTGRNMVLAHLGFCLLVLIGVWTLAASGVWFQLGIGLVAAVVTTLAWTVLRASTASTAAWLFASWSFCLLSTAICLREVLTNGRVTLNHLVGAMCVYLLLGVLWAFTYAGVELAFPGSFHASRGDGSDLDDFVYFSLITLTTTGYGDVLPVAPLARMLATLEAVTGQLYVAILVATLVTQYVGRAPSE